ncbi:hypothetical protein FIBSPDRAFT_726795, partial [Athelia psychrophila]
MFNRPLAVNSILTMPLKHAKNAPAKFRGKPSKIREFILHYELLLKMHNVTDSEDRCDLITRYCSTDVTEFIKALPSYNNQNWQSMKEDLLTYYDADQDLKKYHAPDLSKFAHAARKGKIRKLSEWRTYGRKFITIGGWLLKKSKISDCEFATQYWNGIPRSFRNKIENRLLAKDPARSLTEPFKVSEINAAAEGLLQRDRFDAYLNKSDDDSDSENSSSEDEDSSSDSDDDLRRLRNKIKKKAKYQTKKTRFSVSESDSDSSDDEPQAKTRASKSLKKKVNSKSEPDVDTLIKELNSMSINDPAYAALVYRAMKIDLDILKVVHQSAFATTTSAPPVQYPQRLNTAFQPQPPPHMNSNYSPPRQFHDTQSVPPRPFNSITDECFGCYENGHMMSRCPKLNDLVNKGLLRRIDNKWMMPDGSYVPRMSGESLADACIRMSSQNGAAPNAASHLIRITGLDDQSDPEESFYLSQHTRPYAFPVERAPKTTATRRKEVMDGVYMPPRRGPPMRPGANKENVPVAKVPIQIPVETRKPEFDGRCDDMIIDDDIPIRRIKNKRAADPEPVRNEETQPKDAFEKRVIIPRQSEVSAHTRPMSILNQMLNTRIDLAFGEVLGMSKELSGLMCDKIKLKSIKAPPQANVAASFQTKSRENLINLHMECDGRPIRAIIDTGSELNIVSKHVCDTRIRRPVDLRQTMAIADANGGRGKLIGMVENVPLHCGTVKTLANLYVGSHVPYELILGRPWQKEYQVSIEERKDGTYVSF